MSKSLFNASALLLALLIGVFTLVPALASVPPVRIAVVCGGGSGIEQSIVDKINMRLETNRNVSISTVNPDWYVVCNIKEFMDQMSGQIRYNGTVLVKTTGGQVLSSIAVQQYKQDFSLTPGAPLNKALVDSAAREVIHGAAERALRGIERAVDVEIDTREKIVKAQIMADSEEYDAAINSLRMVSPDSPHFKNARDLMEEFALEKLAMENLKNAEANASKGKYSTALALLQKIPAKSRYSKKAKALASSYRAHLKRPSSKRRLVKNKSTSKTASTSSKQAELKAMDKVLNMEKKALDEAHAKVKKQLSK